MNIKGLNIKGLNISTFDDDALAFLSAANITDHAQRNAINNLVLQMKNIGVWDRMEAVYPLVGGSAESHKWNLKDPQDTDGAFRMTWFGGWTHTDKGAVANGTNSYSDPHMLYGADTTYRYDMSTGLFSTNTTGPAGTLLRTSLGIDGTYAQLFSGIDTNVVSSRCWDLGSNSLTSILGFRRLAQVSRGSNTGFNLRGNNSSDFKIQTTNTYPSSDSDKNYPFIAAQHDESGHPGARAGTYRPGSYGFIFYGRSITSAQQQEFEAIIDTYNKQLGR